MATFELYKNHGKKFGIILKFLSKTFMYGKK